MIEEVINFNLELTHAFGSTCSFNYHDAIAICDEETEEPKILFPAGKTIAKKYVERAQMDFVKFENSAEAIECIHILPTHTHVATSEKLLNSSLRVVRIYSLKGQEKPQTIKIFHERDEYGFIKNIVFSLSEPQFMCCIIGEPHHKLIYVDVSKNKPLAESTFTVKDIDKITISPKNSHLICASGGNNVKFFKVEEYAFKPFEDIKKLPKNRKFLTHTWYKNKTVLVVTDQCEVLLIEEVRTGSYEVKQEYANVFNEPSQDKMLISAICPFSKGFILGSSTGKFCLWIRKEQGAGYEEEKLELVKKWATTEERSSKVTGIAISSKEDLLAISFSNNDITTIFLNELMPQATDFREERENKDVFFEYLYKGFHNFPVTGMDVCLQRPLLATCSHEDSTIRIWNYKNFGCKLLRMFYFRLKESDNKPLITLSFHPCGYYIAVGCKDKLRFFHVLNNELRPYREIQIKGAHIVKFSRGGHMIATASQVREESTEEIIHIFNAVTLEEITSFSVHSKKIKNLEWKDQDECLSSIGENGLLIEWRISDWKEVKKISKVDYKYEFSKYYHEERSIVIFATAYGKNYFHIFKSEDNAKQEEITKFDEIEVDLKITTLHELKLNKRSCLVAGLDNGSVITIKYTNKKLETMSFRNDHIKAITHFSVSPCNRYLISSGADCMIFIYHAYLEINETRVEDDTSSSVDDFLADVVLYPKKEIMKYSEKEKEYSAVIGSLERKLSSIEDESEKKQKQVVLELQVQKNRVIDDFQYRIERIKEQIEIIKTKNLEAITDLDAKNYADAEGMQKKYDEKIDFEKEKFFQLEQEIIQEKILQRNRVINLEKEKEKQVEKINSEFANKFGESEKIYTKSKEIVNKTTNLFDEKINQIESEQEEELRELQERLQFFKTEKAALEEELQQKLVKVKLNYDLEVEDRNSKKKTCEDLQYNKRKIDKEIEEAKTKLEEMKVEYEEKIDILNNKEVKIGEFEKKFSDLQKKKHILSYKATEMKKALEPKEIQIEKLKLDLVRLKKEFETSLERKEKFVLYMEKVEKERQFLEKEVSHYNNEVVKCTNNLDQLIYDIYNSVQNIKGEHDSKAPFRNIIKLYHNYVEKNSKKQETQNQKGVEEMTKQIVHLEKSLFQMNQSNKKNITRKHDEINKRINENAELINNLNDIKKENLELSRRIKQKTLEIESLRTNKNDTSNEGKREDQSYVPSLEEDNMIENLKMNSEKKKMLAFDINPRERNTEILNQFKKRECELVSEIEFLNERIHKTDFFIKEIKESIKKHFSIYKCPGERIEDENDLSSII